ncbi:hypothetical protein IFT84_20525 [Rhizobium sp. CFBP 8762]|uniref:hypothetical protein n=1 Tax=Rhizobium sp. CFBP 8762 TaxID=2775279 RepID=UPI001784C394|nr:hypothetical protein [Rhizobium sp. CFBP 8762]MBD8556898.1 hypothetical protein [Rhizobium sp. CFBP 8762]
MANIIKLAGVSVDADDPCALKAVLEVVRLKLVAGENTEEYSLMSPVTRETVRFSPGNLKALDMEIDRLNRACLVKQNKRPPSRRRLLRY